MRPSHAAALLALAAACGCRASEEREAVLAPDGVDRDFEYLAAKYDAVNTAYAAWPDRMVLVGRDGRIAYHGGRGPFGFLPDELEAAIQAELERAPK